MIQKNINISHNERKMTLLWNVFHISLLSAVLRNCLCNQRNFQHNVNIQNSETENGHRLSDGKASISIKGKTTKENQSSLQEKKPESLINKNLLKLNDIKPIPLEPVFWLSSISNTMMSSAGKSNRDLLTALERLHISHGVIARRRRAAQRVMGGGNPTPRGIKDGKHAPVSDMVVHDMGGLPRDIVKKLRVGAKISQGPSVNSQTEKKASRPKIVHLKNLSISELKYLLQRATEKITGHIQRKELEAKKRELALKKARQLKQPNTRHISKIKTSKGKVKQARLTKKQRKLIKRRQRIARQKKKAELRRQRKLARKKKTQERAKARLLKKNRNRKSSKNGKQKA